MSSALECGKQKAFKRPQKSKGNHHPRHHSEGYAQEDVLIEEEDGKLCGSQLQEKEAFESSVILKSTGFSVQCSDTPPPVW